MFTEDPERTSKENEIAALEVQMMEMKKTLAGLRKEVEPVEVSDYVFKNHNGDSVHLSDLFDGKDELLLISNMGKLCRYCTLWADGFNGFTSHLENRAPFVVVSPDPPEIQKEFYTSRNWRFKMYSHERTSFIGEMGFQYHHGGVKPGVMTFRRDEQGKIFRMARSYFGPGDNYCPMWDFLDMLPLGEKDWAPQYAY
jgi:predicted dithiol-disulfide oxidoreductase (DUF899 family)